MEYETDISSLLLLVVSHLEREFLIYANSKIPQKNNNAHKFQKKRTMKMLGTIVFMDRNSLETCSLIVGGWLHAGFLKFRPNGTPLSFVRLFCVVPLK